MDTGWQSNTYLSIVKMASIDAELPAVLATFPPSPGRSSRLLIAVPSGMLEDRVMLPGLRATLSPIAT
jgi:hypothetical protein